MTRSFLMTTSTIAALIAAPMAFAADDSASDLLGNSPEITEGGNQNPVASNQFKYDTNSPRISNGYAEFDTASIAMSQEAFTSLVNARGEALQSSDGSTIGMIERIRVNAQGNPELVVDLTDNEDIAFEADVLVVTVQPGNVILNRDSIALATTRDELLLKAAQGSRGGYADRKAVTLY